MRPEMCTSMAISVIHLLLECRLGVVRRLERALPKRCVHPQGPPCPHPVSSCFSSMCMDCSGLPFPIPLVLQLGRLQARLPDTESDSWVRAGACQASKLMCQRCSLCCGAFFRIFTWVCIQGLGLLGIVDDDTITAIASDFSLASTGVGSPRNAHCDLGSSGHGEVLSSHLTDTEVIVVEAAAEAGAASGHQAPLKFEVLKVVLRC